ncbi:hypothetical protein QQG74_09165 [Micromonospora sp. FIMYZ51]|uniref:hypothetical protein n=1 Tax=Micromonospora sp. FIMYZ51 TaxID=3051832 RepID=UPI00311D4DBE
MTVDPRIDAAARSLLARFALQPVEGWQLATTTADPDDTEAVQARLAVYASQLRDGTLTAVEEDR